jgi:hypothetical protein
LGQVAVFVREVGVAVEADGEVHAVVLDDLPHGGVGAQRTAVLLALEVGGAVGKVGEVGQHPAGGAVEDADGGLAAAAHAAVPSCGRWVVWLLGLPPQRAQLHWSGDGVGPVAAVPRGQPPGWVIR